MRTVYTFIMHKIVLFILFAGALVALGCGNNTPNVVVQAGVINQGHQGDTANFTTIHWIDSVKDFGVVPFGEKVKIVFHFLNSGNKPLYISNVRPGCGCTLADFTKNAVLPGQQGNVTAEYDSNHGAPGQEVHKTVTVTCNARNETMSTLVFTGNIKPKS